MGRLPSRVLVAGEGPVTAVPPSVTRRAARLHRVGKLVFFGELAGLADPVAFEAHLAPAAQNRLGRLCQTTLRGPEAVLAYLSQYTHRVAISNHRLVSADADTVAFRWKDYRIKRGDG